MSLPETLWKLVERLPVVEVLRDRQVRRYEHDRSKFKEFEAVLSEEQLEAFLGDNDQLSIRRHTLRPISDYFAWQSKLGNQFTIAAVQRSHSAFADSLLRLKNFSASRFAPSEDIENLFTFYPQPGAFSEDQQHLSILLKEVDVAWAHFRNTVKRRLQV